MKRKNTKQAGDARERQVRDLLIANGWTVDRGRLSKGSYDLRATKPERCLLVQVKANTGSPYKNFQPAERNRLAEEAHLYRNGEAWLVHWPPHGEPNWLAEEDWPGRLTKIDV